LRFLFIYPAVTFDCRPVALDTSIDLGLEPEFIERGNNVMNVAVTTIVLAGLFGSLCLKGLGLRVLKVE